MTNDNPHATIARMKKAIALADILSASFITHDQIADASPDMWRTAATVAKVSEPSDETKAMVVEMLHDREKAVSKLVARLGVESANKGKVAKQ